MKTTTAKVRLIASMQPVEAFKKHMPPDATNIEALVSACARSTRRTDELETIYMENCVEGQTPTNIKQYMKWKHGTVFEFTDFIFEISGISRVCSHELVRTRTAAYLQQSQRHVDIRNHAVVVPPTVKEVGITEGAFEMFDNKWRFYYIFLVDDRGIPLEDARFVAPNSVETRVIMKIDGRNLIHFLKLRLDKAAMWEIREVANLMWLEVQKVCPNIFSFEHMEDWV